MLVPKTILAVANFASISKAHVSQISTRLNSTIGFVGLGNMGSQMAMNLAKKGHTVKLYDLNSASVESVIAHAAPNSKFKSVRSLEELVSDENLKTVVTVLPESQHCLAAFGVPKEFGMLFLARKDLTFIDCTTGNISSAMELRDRVAETGSVFIDAPISGGVMAAKKGTLTFMVGTDSMEDFNKVRPILESMGKKIFHCGKVGTGLAAKICNNMLLAISMAGTSEAMSLGMSLGLDPKVLNEIINASSGRCWSSEIYNPVPDILPNVPSSRNYEGGFSSSLMAKDLGLAQDASTKVKTSIPLGSIAHQLYRLISHSDLSHKDFSVMFEFLRSKKI